MVKFNYIICFNFIKFTRIGTVIRQQIIEFKKHYAKPSISYIRHLKDVIKIIKFRRMR